MSKYVRAEIAFADSILRLFKDDEENHIKFKLQYAWHTFDIKKNRKYRTNDAYFRDFQSNFSPY